MSGYGHGSPQQNGGRRMFSCKPCRMLKIKCDRKQPCTPCQVAYTAKYCLYKGDKGYDGDGVDPPKRSLQDYARSEACQNLVQSLVKADASLAEFGATTGEIQGTLKVLQAAMSTEQGIRAVKNCAEGHHEMIVNLLDAVLERVSPQSRQYTTVFHALRKLCAQHGHVPDSLILPRGSVVLSPSTFDETGRPEPHASGGFADIYMGQWKGQVVGIKAMKTSSRDSVQLLKRIAKEATIWRRLAHPNITPFYGVDTEHFKVSMVCKWMSHGHIIDFLGEYPEESRPRLLLDVARGLAYLHSDSVGIIHGDLKGANILIDEHNSACLTDFGVSTIVYETSTTLNTVTQPCDFHSTLRYMAPEIHDPERFLGEEVAKPSRESDVYTYSMVMWEIFTGEMPYQSSWHDGAIINKIVNGARPQRPPDAARLGLSDTIWCIMGKCWNGVPSTRPSILEVISDLEHEWSSWFRSHRPTDAEKEAGAATTGSQAMQNTSGMFLGPTSNVFAVNQFVGGRPSQGLPGFLSNHVPVLDVRHHDADIVAQLPDHNTVEYLINHYFECCNWIYRFVHEPTIRDAWWRFRNGQSMTRVELATVCVVIAIAIQYLPLSRHKLFSALRGSAIELGNTCFKLSRDLLERHREIMPTHTLEFVELLLAQTHYLIVFETRLEEVCIMCGELLTIATAMGLHCDPQNVLPVELAERRRWAWWNLILIERWQAFCLGRLNHNSSDHFDVQLPAENPNPFGSDRLFLPHFALFKLMHISAATLDEATAKLQVTWSVLQQKDKLLTDWFAELPHEMLQEGQELIDGLASLHPVVRRPAVQGTILRFMYNSLRFTLHRPWILLPTSLDVARQCASELLRLMAKAKASRTPAHFMCGPFQTEVAATFLSQRSSS